MADVTDQSDDMSQYPEARLWMNDREKHWVADLGVLARGHGPGMNQTPGGQGDCLVLDAGLPPPQSSQVARDAVQEFEQWPAEKPGSP